MTTGLYNEFTAMMGALDGVLGRFYYHRRIIKHSGKEIRRMKQAIIWTSIIVSSVFSLCQAEVRYTVTDLGTLGGDVSDAQDINDSGQIVGYSYTTEGMFHGFLYENGMIIDLGTLGGYHSKANAINNHGQITGHAWTSEGNIHPFLSDGITMTDLGTLGERFSYAYGINDSGSVVGKGRASAPFLYDGTEMISLSHLFGDSGSAYDINNHGHIAGYGSNYHAFLYDGITVTDLGTLGGNVSSAHSINNHGHIVGSSSTSKNLRTHAFLYDGTNMIDLGALRGLYYATANDINDNGQIVGTSEIDGHDEDPVYHAFLYNSKEGMLDLNDLISSDNGWTLEGANGINNSGQIVGYGEIDGEIHAYLLTPIPEPTTISIDIKPASCPNPLNIKSKGVLSVAILGTEELDVSDIDLSTLLLEGAAPLRAAYKDVATPVRDDSECACTAEGADGYTDLILKFDRQEVIAGLGEVSDGELWKLYLTGTLKDGTQIEGSDCLKIIRRGRKESQIPSHPDNRRNNRKQSISDRDSRTISSGNKRLKD